MSSTPDIRPAVRLATAADVVDAVPYLVGFHPRDSLVVLSLRDARGRLGATMRVDLPSPARAAECARGVARRLRHDGALASVAVVYPPAPGLEHPAVTAVADALEVELRREAVELGDVLVVRKGRWWSLTELRAGGETAGVPVPDPGTSVLAAAMAADGRRVLASREEMLATLDPVGGALAAEISAALARVDAALAERVWRGEADQVEAESRELLRAAVRSRLDGAAPLTADEAARLIVALDDTAVRDEVVLWAEGDWGAATRALLGELVRRAVPPFGTAPLAVLGWLAYQQGDATLAGMAAERALAIDAGYGLARLLADAVTSGVDPATFTAARAEIAARLRGRRDGKFARLPRAGNGRSG